MTSTSVAQELQQHTHGHCPNCGASQCAGLIKDKIAGGPYSDEEIADMYGSARCYEITIGIEIPGKYDGVSYWRYPCCGATYDRFTGERTYG